jgi:prepilin-type N-terminal cleavage/methylation domain-containing protein
MSIKPDNIRRGNREGLTLVEVSVAIAVMGVVLTLAIPAYVKARKETEGRRITNDARQMDNAIDQWATDTQQTEGQAVNTTAAAAYLSNTWVTTDLLGNDFTFGEVGTQQVQISPATKTALANVGIDWGPY